MKKFTLLACLCALAFGQPVVAQEASQSGERAQEITYVEDPSQGYLFNRFKDNWFVTAEAGAGIYLAPNATVRDFMDRWNPAASIYVGKWFSPLLGIRGGVSWIKNKDLVEPGALGDSNAPMLNGLYKASYHELGGVFDVMLNVTNWLCGYYPGRKYSLVAYLGGGGYWSWFRDYDANGNKDGWEYMDDRLVAFRAGIINGYRITDAFQLSLDIRFTGLDNHPNEAGANWNKTAYNLHAFLGATYLFNKREWSAPIVPVCPEPENCDKYIAIINAADAKIADLEKQLKDCLEKPEPEPEEAPLATVYFPKNVFKISKNDANLLKEVAEVMKDNPDKTYILTGWADNYTGNDQINTRLRNNRVNGVEKYLLKQGVSQSQLVTKISAANLVDLGEKYQALGRAVTIEEGN